MKPTDLTLYTVLVFASPPPGWKRASQPIARCEAAPLVARHWAKGRMAKLHPPLKPMTVVGTGGEVVAFVPAPASPFGRRGGPGQRQTGHPVRR